MTARAQCDKMSAALCGTRVSEATPSKKYLTPSGLSYFIIFTFIDHTTYDPLNETMKLKYRL